MNTKEKVICLLLGLALVWCFLSGRNTEESKGAADSAATTAEVAATNGVESVTAATNAVTNVVAKAEVKAPAKIEPELPSVPEEIAVLENDEIKLELTSWGAGVKAATLKKFALKAGEPGDSNPAVQLDYSLSPLGVLGGLEGVAANAAYTVKEKGEGFVVFANAAAGIERKITLGKDYKVTIEDSFANPSILKDGNSMSLGVMTMGPSNDDILAIDAKGAAEGSEVVYYGSDDEHSLYNVLAGVSAAGGCGCGGPRKVTPADPAQRTETVYGAQSWIAVKDRFFVTALVKSSQENKGFAATVSRNLELPVYRPDAAAVNVLFAGGAEKRTSEFFIGPKKQALLGDAGMREVMDFGMWSFLCYPMVWCLNFFNDLIPNYGIAIILLTILVRLVFWPLTRKSTEGMKKMQEIQPLLKEIQAKYKDNPQRLQQETWALYREKKVNPLSSCLPMLIQIPIFIALFNVLRSMVELRYAGFLWIDDLSAPEALFSSWFPFGGLNILPILMAATMYLQSKLTPSTGDQNQQRMMTVFMPLMMLFMFYNFASALSLYWTVSQVLSIVQMWMMRRETARKAKVLEPEVIDPPAPTRQMRRHS